MTLRWFWYMERAGTDGLPERLSTRTTLRSVFDMVYLNLSLPELSFVPVAKRDTFVSFFGPVILQQGLTLWQGYP